MSIIGTAGHVDHGKSALVEALTGKHPDRLKEEQEREMTIDLGFGMMHLADEGSSIAGIIDVPGHRDFIENMLAGIGGIDAVLLVIAADEGVMPQTREHLAIIDILQISAGVIALNKVDLIDDPEWLDLVEADVRQVVRGTVLENAPILRVSAREHTGIEELRCAITDCLKKLPDRSDRGRARLPVDRVFTMPGFGTVVTGTLLDGRVNFGDEMEILPSGVRGRIRSVHVHNSNTGNAFAGSRAALNITGVTVDQIKRGDVVAAPGKYQPTQRIDVQFRLQPDASAPLKHSSEVKFYLGTAEILARVRLLGDEEIGPGQSGWLQLELREPTVAMRGDRYLLRRPSPGETLGGGMVVDSHPAARHKRQDAAVLARLEGLYAGSPDDVLLQVFQRHGAMPIREAVALAHLPDVEAAEALEILTNSLQAQVFVYDAGTVTIDCDLLAIDRQAMRDLTDAACNMLDAYHRTYPLRQGMPREEFRSRLKVTSTRHFQALLRSWLADGLIRQSKNYICRCDFQVQMNDAQRKLIDQLMVHYTVDPYAPPTIKQVKEQVGEEIYQALIIQEVLVPVSEDLAFHRADYQRMQNIVLAHFRENETLTAAQLRDILGSSRRYVLAYLEHLDAIGITVRDGDVRRQGKQQLA